MAVTIRPATLGDTEAIARLAAELSYPCSAAEMRARLQPLLESDSDAVLVAQADDGVVGWMHVTRMESLESDPHAEIRGLIVAERVRSRGVGALFVAQAIEWARERALPKVRVRTNETRQRTHVFYEREGFSLKKAQRVYDRAVNGVLRTEG